MNHIQHRYGNNKKVLLASQLIVNGRESTILLVVSDSLWPHGLQHPRVPHPSLFPEVCSNSCPLSWWCHLTFSSSVIPFSFYPQSFPASEYFSCWYKFFFFFFQISIKRTDNLTNCINSTQNVMNDAFKILWWKCLPMLCVQLRIHKKKNTDLTTGNTYAR